jgi:hypothetical protein
MIVTNPQYISNQFNAFCIQNIDRMLKHNKDCEFGHDAVNSNIKFQFHVSYTNY